jgi:hypothetical protein
MSSQYYSSILRSVIGNKFLDSRDELRYCRSVDIQTVANLLLLHAHLEVISNDEITVRIRDFNAPRHLDSN